MKITNLGIGNTALPSQAPIDAAEAAGSDTPAPSATAASSTYAPSPEFQKLIDQARAEPSVREDRVQAASARLQQGYYHTSASMGQTAQAMLTCAD